MSYAAAITGNPYRLRARTGRPKRREQERLTWQEILRDNADFPGAFIRYYWSLGKP